MQEFNDNAVALAPWSATLLKKAIKCPFQVHASKVVKAKEEWDILPDNTAMIVGIKVHKLLELLIGKFPKENFPDNGDLNTMSLRFRQIILEDEDITVREIDAINSMYNSALSIAHRILAHRYKTEAQCFVEKEVGIDRHLQPIGFFDKKVFFRGKIDNLLITPQGGVAIIDFKTGNWPGLRGHEQQLRCYEVMTYHSLKNHIKRDYNIQLSSFTSGLAFVPSEEIIWDKTRPVIKVENSGTTNFINTINNVSDEVVNKVIRRGNHCNHCGYKHLCGSRRGKGKKKATTKETINL